MKKISIALGLIAIMAISLLSCKCKMKAQQSLAGNYVVLKLGNIEDPSWGGSQATLFISKNLKSFGGYGTCNSFFGDIQVNTKNHSIQLFTKGITRKACHMNLIETDYLSSLAEARSYTFDKDGHLLIFTAKDNQKPILVLKREVKTNQE